MHIIAILVGVLLMLFCAPALIMGLTIGVNARRVLRSQGIQENPPKDPAVSAILIGHSCGVIVALLMLCWGLRWI
jgi:hypothetical protein